MLEWINDFWMPMVLIGLGYILGLKTRAAIKSMFNDPQGLDRFDE